MNSPSNQPGEPQSIEELGNTLLANAKQSIHRNYEECEQCIRNSPTKSVLSALAAGYFLHRLPVRSILVALAPPAIFVFGAVKLYEFLQKQESINEKCNQSGEGDAGGGV